MERTELRSILEKQATRYFEEGYNCCQSILLATNDAWNLGIDPMLISAGQFFRNGMGSGSTCGALIGAQMALGILNERYRTQLKIKTAHTLYNEFVSILESSDCKDLRKKQGFRDKLGSKGCKVITQTTAGILCEFWENINGQEK